MYTNCYYNLSLTDYAEGHTVTDDHELNAKCFYYGERGRNRTFNLINGFRNKGLQKLLYT